MKKVLILTSEYCGKATANGICAKNLQTALNEQGCTTYMLGCTKEDENSNISLGENEFFFLYNRRKAKYSFFRKAYNILQRYVRIQLDEKFVKLYAMHAEEIIKKYEIDALIAVTFPMETAVVARKLKKRFPQLCTIEYELDSVTTGINNCGKPDITFIAKKRYMRKLYKSFDGVFVMNSHKEQVNEYYRDVLSEKLVVADLPMLTKTGISCEETDEKALVYEGSLIKEYRNPAKLLEAFGFIKDEELTLHFYSRGDCEEDLKKALKKDKRVFSHGYVAQKELDLVEGRASSFINIGNKYSECVPSKLIKYIAVGKPIIHFSLKENDVCETYLEKYPLALIISKDESAETAAKRIAAFVQENSGEQIEFENICEIFYKNTPQYSARMIADCIMKKCV